MVAARPLPAESAPAPQPALSHGTAAIPLPTARLVALFALAALPALFAVAWAPAAWVTVGLVLALLAGFGVDAVQLRGQQLLASRPIPELLHAFAENALELELENPGRRTVAGRWLDLLPDGTERSRSFLLRPRERLTQRYTVKPPRGRARFGPLHLRIEGPWRLASRDGTAAVEREAKVYPDLRELGDALLLARPKLEGGLARLRRLGEGREFDALRPYREGDDLRAIDWKATARRAQLVAREYVPEKNQAVILLVDCGRLFVGRERDRTRLDFAIEAALRLARTSLERGDAVGLVAFGSEPRAFVAPAKGRMHLRALTEAVFGLQPELEESDYAAAFDLIARATSRRALVCTFTDVVDEDASRVLLARTLALRPRHLPLVVMLQDSELTRLQLEAPVDVDGAYARAAAIRLLRERDAAVARLRATGATVVSAPPDGLSAAAINAYLRIKDRGLL